MLNTQSNDNNDSPSPQEIIAILLIFTGANAILSLIGFSSNFNERFFSIMLFFSFFRVIIWTGAGYVNYVKLIFIPYFAITSVLIFSDSDFLRGFDLAMLMISTSFFSITLLSKFNSSEFLFRLSYIFSFSHSAYSLLIEFLRNPGFLSLINKAQIAFSLLLLVYLFIIKDRENHPTLVIIRDIPLAAFLGSFFVIVKSQKTDFPWDSLIWPMLIWICSISFLLWLILIKNEARKNPLNIELSVSQLVFLSLSISAYFLLPGIFDHQETRKHVVYHLGLFNLLSENVFDNGFLNKCTEINLPKGSSGIETGEPGGCWVYPTGWWSLPVWTLVPFLMMGFDGIQSARLLSMLLRATSAILIGIIVKRYSKIPSASVIAVISFLTCTQVSHYGRIYTWQQFDDIFILLGILLWIPSIIPHDNKSSSRLLFPVIYSICGSIIMGFGASAVSCYFAFLLLFFSNIDSRIRYATFSIILFSSISSWLIWSRALEYYYDSSNAAEEQIFWKLNYRSGEGELLFSSEYFVELFSQSAFLLGPLLCIGILILIMQTSVLSSSRRLSEEGAMLVVFSPFLFLWLVNSVLFPQSGFSHDYLAFWTLTPALCAIVGDYFGRLNKNIVIVSIIALLFISINEREIYENKIHDPDMVSLHHWIYENTNEDDEVLLSHDLYKEHYIAAISGRNLHHYYQSAQSEVIQTAIIVEEIDIILTNSTGWENWKLEEVLSEGWCFEEFSGTNFNYFAAYKCDPSI